ncbi:hypothetical protein EYR40_004671 [Pleurotus pulmonarius]|nr:hypothetical protein EYR40_004671 [Pleurotus pulmonarius]
MPNNTNIMALAIHPGAVHTGQQDQFKEAYGEVLGAGTVWAAVSREVDGSDGGGGKAKWQGSYVTDPGMKSNPTAQASIDELAKNLWRLREELVQEKLGSDGLLKWGGVKGHLHLLAAKQLALVVFSLLGLVVFSIMASTWTSLILMFGLSQPQGPSAASQREDQQCNSYADFWRNNPTVAATANAEGAPSAPRTPSPDTDAAPNSNAWVDSDGVHKVEG